MFSYVIEIFPHRKTKTNKKKIRKMRTKHPSSSPKPLTYINKVQTHFFPFYVYETVKPLLNIQPSINL